MCYVLISLLGWIDIRNEANAHYRPEKHPESTEWPPRFWKFTLETQETPKAEAAFVDSRRFGRVRLVDCPGAEIRNFTPLKENGPDPVIDREKVTLEWLTGRMKSKHVPIKALLLDQAQISGIGNWVGDEIMYHAKLHPEQYSDTFSKEQTARLHESILHITKTAVDVLGDSDKFPDDWMFKHRWGKGKKDAKTTLPNGEKIVFLTVGGRTSCVVPSVQKKTGPVFGDIGEKGDDGIAEPVKAQPKKRKDVDKDEDSEEDTSAKTKSRLKKLKTEKEEKLPPNPTPKIAKGTNAKESPKKAAAKGNKVKVEEAEAPTKGRRRSGRVSNGKE
jgi:formamidopyrimidine-DNA glycosylase